MAPKLYFPTPPQEGEIYTLWNDEDFIVTAVEQTDYVDGSYSRTATFDNLLDLTIIADWDLDRAAAPARI